MIVQERERQEANGYTAAHDVEHSRGELALQAAAYAVSGAVQGLQVWPTNFDHGMRDLARAGALIAAEIDRRLVAEAQL